MRKSEENKLIWEQYLEESPLRIHSLSEEPSALLDGIDLNFIKKASVEVKDFGTFKLYEYKKDSNIVSLLALDEKECIAYCKYLPLSGGGITLDLIWNRKEYPGTFRTILAEYILPTFKYVESGDIMTDLGFKFFENMMTIYPNFTYYVNIGGKLMVVDNPSQFSQYKEGENEDHNYSTFVITL